MKTHLHIGLGIICFWILLDQKDRFLVNYVASNSEDHSDYLREFVANEMAADGSTAALEPCRLKATSVINRAVRHQIEQDKADEGAFIDRYAHLRGPN